LHARGYAFAPSIGGLDPWQVMLVAVEALLRQIGFWIGAWLVPTVYRVFAADRAVCLVSAAGLTGLTLLNFLALALLLAAGMSGFRRLRSSNVPRREAEFTLALCMLFLLGYSAMIAVGRATVKGFLYISTSIYYGYVADLTVCIAIALVAAVGRTSAAATTTGDAAGSSRISPVASFAQTPSTSRIIAAFIAALAVLATVNAYGVRKLAHELRYDYAAPRQQVIDRVLAWRKQLGNSTQRYFVVASPCRGNPILPGFDGRWMRKDYSTWRGPVTLADALWADRSANLNAARIPIPPDSVDQIRCDEATVPR
jgi:hypothetical protein